MASTKPKPLKLNAAQERFAVLVAGGAKPSAAYREVYPKSKGCSDKTAGEKASRLRGKIGARIAELRDKIADAACMEKGEALRYLTDAIRTPIEAIDASSPLCQERIITTGDGWETVKYKSVSKLDAWDKLAKALGWYEPEKHEVALTDTLAERIAARNAQRRELPEPSRN